jgi:hypothetical protein
MSDVLGEDIASLVMKDLDILDSIHVLLVCYLSDSLESKWKTTDFS